MQQRHRDRAGADLTSAAPLATRVGCSGDPISAQAMRLHGLGMAASAADGLLERDEAERLADRCGALTDELVDAGLWIELDHFFGVDGLPSQGRSTPTDDTRSRGTTRAGRCAYPLATDPSNGRPR